MAPSQAFAKSAWVLASIVVIVAALYLSKGVLVPLTLAVLLSFLLSPVCDWLERRRLGRSGCIALSRPTIGSGPLSVLEFRKSHPAISLLVMASKVPAAY